MKNEHQKRRRPTTYIYHIHSRRGLKSSKIQTTDSLVVKRVKFPNEMVFASQGKPSVYREMSLAQFINGYLEILTEETDTTRTHMLSHLQEMMEDSEVYRWTAARDFHAAACQKIKHGRTVWGETSRKDKLRLLLVWSRPAIGSKQPSLFKPIPQQQPQTQGTGGRKRYFSQPSKPVDHACQV